MQLVARTGGDLGQGMDFHWFCGSKFWNRLLAKAPKKQHSGVMHVAAMHPRGLMHTVRNGWGGWDGGMGGWGMVGGCMVGSAGVGWDGGGVGGMVARS